MKVPTNKLVIKMSFQGQYKDQNIQKGFLLEKCGYWKDLTIKIGALGLLGLIMTIKSFQKPYSSFWFWKNHE